MRDMARGGNGRRGDEEGKAEGEGETDEAEGKHGRGKGRTMRPRKCRDLGDEEIRKDGGRNVEVGCGVGGIAKNLLLRVLLVTGLLVSCGVLETVAGGRGRWKLGGGQRWAWRRWR